jgi:sodium/potassium-transporting ATPase subunit beta
MTEMDLKEKSTNHYSLAYDRPEEEATGFINFLWNPKTKEVLGRTGSSWAKITIFYIIYYICLAIFFVTCYKIFAAISLKENEPRWTLDDSLIGSNPGVGFRPMPDQDKNTDSSLIWINLKRENYSSFWVDELDRFFMEQRKPKKAENGMTCTFQNGRRANATHVCNIHQEDIKECSKGIDGYGYFSGSPCVLIKLNKIFNFVPEPYTEKTLSKADERGMPKYLQKQILTYAKSSTKFDQSKLDSTWVSCEGENPGDVENIGKLEYYAPGSEISGTQFYGIPNFYYPYMNQDGYQTPFLFVKFLNPQKNILIQVECKAWAYNILADRVTRMGSTHIELIIDTEL